MCRTAQFRKWKQQILFVFNVLCDVFGSFCSPVQNTIAESRYRWRNRRQRLTLGARCILGVLLQPGLFIDVLRNNVPSLYVYIFFCLFDLCSKFNSARCDGVDDHVWRWNLFKCHIKKLSKTFKYKKEIKKRRQQETMNSKRANQSKGRYRWRLFLKSSQHWREFDQRSFFKTKKNEKSETN